MKHKIFLLICSMFLSLLMVNAAVDKVHVTMIGEFDTVNPSQTIDVRVLESNILGNHVVKTGDIIRCDVLTVTEPKRGKRKASFTVRPTEIISNGETTVINENICGKYAEKIISKEELKKVDKVKVGKKAVLTVGNHFVKGLTAGVTLAEGMIENEEGNRIESGVKKVYKESPLSYAEKGEELDLETGESFYLIFKPAKDTNSNDVQ